MNETNFKHVIIKHNGTKYEKNEILYKQLPPRLLLLAYKFNGKNGSLQENCVKTSFVHITKYQTAQGVLNVS
jgi:hypothetical protein